jgi:hypothetical protein
MTTGDELATIDGLGGPLSPMKPAEGMVVQQRDLGQSFLRINVEIEDEEGKKATLRLRPRHGA